MKLIGSILVILLCGGGLRSQAASEGGGGYDHGNGGDMCEYRFKVVRDDIRSWILNGGSADLRLPAGISHEVYRQRMLERVQIAKVDCIDKQILVSGAEKTCRNFVAANGTLKVQCNRKLFLATAEADQYVLVHHEYAGLAGFEVNVGESSSYEISTQITGYLENQIIKKLAVKPAVNPAEDPFNPASCRDPQMSIQDAYNLVPIGKDGTFIGGFSLYTRMRRCDQVDNCEKWEAIANQATVYDRDRNKELIFLPSQGVMEFSSSHQRDRYVQFRTDFGNSVGRGLLIQCGFVERFDGSCQVLEIPKMRFIGDAFGVIGAHCSRIAYTQKAYVSLSERIETELVFIARY